MRNSNVIKNYLLIFTGFLVISLFLWFRFLRVRVPRNIPFTLLVLSFITILFATCIYFYIVYRFINPSKNSKLSKEIREIFLTPLEAFNNVFMQYYNLKQIFLPLYSKINNVFVFYFSTIILPRMITAIALITDIFILEKFYYMYKVICITIIPLLTRYFIYSLTKIKDLWIMQLSTEIDHIITPYVMGVHPCEWPENQTEDSEEDAFISDTMALPLNIFISHQTNIIIAEETPPHYFVIHNDIADKNYAKQFHVDEITSEHLQIMIANSKQEITKILELSVFIATYQQAYVLHKYLRDLQIILYSLYFLSWSTVLYLSAPKVLWITGLISLLHSLSGIEDPFSGGNMYYDFLIYLIENDDIFIIDIIPNKI